MWFKHIFISLSSFSRDIKTQLGIHEGSATISLHIIFAKPFIYSYNKNNAHVIFWLKFYFSM
jgi:hypothetical protein